MATTTTIPAAPTWDLESVFSGGSKSVDFENFRDKIKQDLAVLATKLQSLPKVLDSSTLGAWKDFILSLQQLYENAELLTSFAHCLVSQNMEDAEAHKLESEGDTIVAEIQKLKVGLEALSLTQKGSEWKLLLSQPEVEPISTFLDEMRELARRKMPLELESLALDLSVNGYHAWNRFYDKMAGELRVTFEEADRAETLSLGQLATKMSDPDRNVRHQAFRKMTGAWESRAELAAMNLNALAGYRLTLYKNRKWDNDLFEPLWLQRLQQGTLDSMWRVIAKETHRLKPYIDAKKRILGIDKFSWWDEFAPVGGSDTTYSYDEAADFVVQKTKPFSAHLSNFFSHAIKNNWVEAEDRPGKAGGAYCTGLGPKKESRVFMTYAGTYENLLTLAHELGHAYHGWVLKEKPYFATLYPMTLAETASIISELIVTDAALREATERNERLMLLDQKLQQSYVFFCDLHCRYIFERSFYQERAQGMVTRERLCELMIDAQRKAYGDLLDPSGFHPYFWCSKLHFYISELPFYNFPYTFGYLFAVGVYDRARKEGAAFADKYRALLSDSGSMSTEAVAKKHLGVDLTGETFWEDAVALATADAAEFVKLSR